MRFAQSSDHRLGRCRDAGSSERGLELLSDQIHFELGSCPLSYLPNAADGKYFLNAGSEVLKTLSMQKPSLFLRDLTVLDFAFFDETQGLLGESYYVSAELEGSLDEQDFLLDFGPAKKALKEAVDTFADHKLVLAAEGKGVERSSSTLTLSTPTEFYSYTCPKEAVVEIPGESITKDQLEAALANYALPRLPKNVSAVRFFLREDPRFQVEPNFRYTHGLRLHQGNCQRLFHGHRNPIEVWVKGERSKDWEAELASEWENAHFARESTVENRASVDLPLGERRKNLTTSAIVSYQSPQGLFRAEIPASRIVLLPSEPSIEKIAEASLQWLLRRGLQDEFRVVAYEGLNKGYSVTFRPGASGESSSSL